jgi:hypothetical protein
MTHRPFSLSRDLSCFIWCLLLFSPARAETVDTVLAGNGTPGPYVLGNRFVDPASIAVNFSDSAHESALPFTFVPDVNGILFSATLDSGARFSVRFATKYSGVPKSFALYRKSYIDFTDTLMTRRDSLIKPGVQRFSGEDLDVSGYKSVGIAVGSQGAATIEQATEVTVYGDVAPQTRLSAHLSDQGSSLDQGTREISDIDMIYITLTNPKYDATIGDQYLRWPGGGMLTGEKKLKGISATLHTPSLLLKGFGALSRGKLAVQTFKGVAGLQGPYQLTGGSDQPQLITIIGGTVSVTINGIAAQEGEGKDYEVDYDLGTISFTPRRLIRDDDIIRIEYEYTTYDYQRALAGTELGWTTRDSAFSIHGAFWHEADNKSLPIDLELTPADRDSLAAAGDNPWRKIIGRPVAYTHADSAAQYDALYVKETDSLGRQHFVWAGLDSIPVDQQLYGLSFHRTDPGVGDYRFDTTICPQQGICYDVYRYTGQGGDFSAQSVFPAPQRTMVGEVIASAKPSPWVSAMVDVAAQELDKNLFSARDDNDNTSAASHASVLLGQKRFDRRTAWLGADHRFIGAGFSQDILSATQRKNAWNDTLLELREGQKHFWESFAGITFFPNVSTEFSYGQSWRADSLQTERFSNATAAKMGDHLTAVYDGSLFRNQNDPEHNRTRRDGLRLNLDMGKTAYALSGGDEWWYGGAGANRGHASAAGSFEFRPLSFRESISATAHLRSDRGILASVDTGYSLQWDQSLDHSFFPGWRLGGLSSYYRFIVYAPHREDVTSLVKLTSDVATKNGFSTRQEYTITQERASVIVQEPHFVGVNGSYTRDTTGSGDRYIPKIGGQWDIIEREIFDTTGQSRMRKTSLTLSWSFLPGARGIGGILGDLDWKGNGAIEEHLLRPDALPLHAWAPGWLTLDRDRADDSLVRFADVFYRQDLDWHPRTFEGWHGSLFGKPFVRMVRGYRESGVEAGGEIDKKYNHWLWNCSLQLLSLDHTGDDMYAIKDRFIELTQQYALTGDLYAYVKETIGRGLKTPRGDSYSGRYGSLKPGLHWQPLNKGFGDLSYTFSYLDADRGTDYRIGRGNPSGIGHIIDAFADVRLSDHFSLSASYRGEVSRLPQQNTYGPAIHTLSMEMKAYL